VKLYIHTPNTPSWRGAQLKSQGHLLPLPHRPTGGSSGFTTATSISGRQLTWSSIEEDVDVPVIMRQKERLGKKT